MKVVISRSYQNNETLGSLFIFAGQKIEYRCKTIELPSNGNQKFTSCIPEGVYDVEKHTSERHGQCFHVLNVPNRSDILFHSGNYAAGKKTDTEGCILPGSSYWDINGDGNLDIIESRQTMTELYAILPEKFKLYII